VGLSSRSVTFSAIEIAEKCDLFAVNMTLMQ